MVINGTSDDITNDPAPGSKKRALKGAATLFWVLVILSQAWLLVGDVTLFGPPPARFGGERGEPLAEIVSATRDVRVRLDRDVVWNEGRGGEKLVDGQSVMTLEGSSAELAFADGTGLVLGESSLVQVRKPTGAGFGAEVPLLVSLVRGTVRKSRSRAGRPLAVQLGETRVKFSPESEVSLSAAGEGAGYTLQVAEGEVELETPGGVVRAGAGDRVSLDAESDKAEVSRFAIRALAPADQEMVDFGSERLTVEFRWTGARESAAYMLELSRDPAFSGEVRTVRAEEPSAKEGFDLSRDAGAWYWRVRGEGGSEGDASSDVRKLWLRIPPLPAPAYPPAGALIERTDAGVGFQWEHEGGAGAYEVRVETLAGEEARTVRSEDKSARVQGLSPGAYRWLVRAVDAKGRATPWSAWREFRLLEKVPDKLPAPKPVGAPKFIRPGKPEGSLWRRVLRGALTWVLPGEARAADRGAPSFSGGASGADGALAWDVLIEWGEVEGADGYRVQVARKKNFKEILAESTTRETRWTLSYRLGMENSKGRFYYRVAAVEPGGAIGEFSEPVQVSVPKAILAQRGGKGSATTGSTAAVGGSRPAAKRPSDVASSSAAEPVVPVEWDLAAELRVHLSSFSQTTGTARLTGVESDGLFAHQAVRLEARRLRAEVEYRFVIDVSGASFTSAPIQDLDLPEASALDVSLWGFRTEGAPRSGRLRWMPGLLARYGHRWTRVADEELEAAAGYSFGPALGGDYRFPWAGEARLLAPDRVAFAIGLPLLGLAGGDFFWGPQAEASVAWDAFSLGGVPFEVALRAAYELSLWSEPASTTLSRFSAALGLSATLF